MATFKAKINSVLGGVSPTLLFSQDGQYNGAIGIDPDMPIQDTSGALLEAVRTSGLIRPTAMAKFSASEVTGVPLWMVPNPKDSNTYVYANDGKVHTVTSSLAMGTALNGGAALSTASGNGAAYYDNYVYFRKNTDVARYGPLNGAASLNQTYWSSTLSKTALTNTTYPSLRGIAMPNGVMHRHSANGTLYFTDVVGNQGVLHYIKTTKTTVEGDTDDGSTYNALDFNFGYYPTAIESYGTDIAVALIETTDTTINQKPAILTFWDTTSASINKIVDVVFPDPFITALKNVNGILYVWSGNAQGGVRLSRFLGGYTFEEVCYLEEGTPPFAGAVDHDMNRVIWGSWVTYPESAATVWALGSKNQKLAKGLHSIAKSTSSDSSNQAVTCLKYLEQSSNKLRLPVIGWSDGTGKGLDKRSTTYSSNMWRSEVFRIGQPFQINKIRIPLAQLLTASMTITAKIIFDDLTASTTITPTINSTNFASKKNAVIKPKGLKGEHNFFLELRWTGTALATVSLPITIEGETLDD